MIREEKYQPQTLNTYCPACGNLIDKNEWNDYGMHLRCTEYYSTRQYLERSNQNEAAYCHELLGAMDF